MILGVALTIAAEVAGGTIIMSAPKVLFKMFKGIMDKNKKDLSKVKLIDSANPEFEEFVRKYEEENGEIILKDKTEILKDNEKLEKLKEIYNILEEYENDPEALKKQIEKLHDQEFIMNIPIGGVADGR